MDMTAEQHLFRTGGHHGVTIIRQGSGQPDDQGRRPGDALVAVVTNGDTRLAQAICDGLNPDPSRAGEREAGMVEAAGLIADAMRSRGLLDEARFVADYAERGFPRPQESFGPDSPPA